MKTYKEMNLPNFVEEYKSDLKSFKLLEESIEKRIFGKIDLALSNVIACFENEKLIGVLVYEEFDFYFWLSPIEILPKYQNQGIGKILIKKLKEKVTKDVCLSCSVELSKWYLKQDFFVTHSDSDFCYMEWNKYGKSMEF